MQTTHEIHVADARELDETADDSVDLVVTSPPYPMIEMWDDLFADLDPSVGDHLAEGDGDAAFRAMHDALGGVWNELARVLKPGGIAAINVGDATRKLDGSFQLYPNHGEILDRVRAAGLTPLPDILWRKPSNRLTKFMGSGMLPSNAYATLEHEYILLFRNGETRTFEPRANRRYEAAYFWEERNEWFSDLWADVHGEGQELDHRELRERSAAFPFTIPHRLVNMYSVYGDTVLDPFWGTGTTSLAAIVSGRNSVGYELASEFTDVFDERVERAAALAETVNGERIERHREFAADRDLGYEAENYDFEVKTEQERQIRLYGVESVRRDGDAYRVEHRPFDPSG